MAVVLAAATRQGSWESSPVTVSQGGKWRVSIIGIPTAEFEDTSKSLTLSLLLSNDAGASWREKYWISWRGGRYIGKDSTVDPSPTLTVDLSPYVGQRAKVVGSVPSALTFGIDVTRL